MKNRAKCKKCNSIIESFHRTDYVECQCKEISVYGGPDLMQCAAMDWKNFLRVDDLGNEISVKIEENNTVGNVNESSKPNKKTLKYMIKEMIDYIDKLPNHAKEAPVSNYEFQTLLVILLEFFSLEEPLN